MHITQLKKKHYFVSMCSSRLLPHLSSLVAVSWYWICKLAIKLSVLRSFVCSARIINTCHTECSSESFKHYYRCCSLRHGKNYQIKHKLSVIVAEKSTTQNTNNTRIDKESIFGLSKLLLICHSLFTNVGQKSYSFEVT